jgi:hypothetical protein
MLFCRILRLTSSIWQRTAHLTPVQVKNVSISELFHFTQILSTSQIISREIWIGVNRTLLNQSWCSPGQCPVVTVIPAIHCRTANLNRIYNSNICRRYCCISHRQWSWHFFTETANQSTRNTKIVKELEIKANESKSVHVTFTTRTETCLRVHINNVTL